MGELLHYVISKIEATSHLQAKKISNNIEFQDGEYQKNAEEFLAKYAKVLATFNKNLDYAIDCYRKMCSDIMYEQIRFSETGAYSSTSFEDVNREVYSNPERMTYYMHGLLLSQFLWMHHYKMFHFFVSSLQRYKKGVRKYLEVGGGHGLLISEALKVFGDDVTYDLIDISSSSIEIAKRFIGNCKVNYVLDDILKFKTGHRYDFIAMGEVLEHVEHPELLLSRVRDLLTDTGHLFITVPMNAPAVDHIYLFRDVGEIKEMLNKAGFKVIEEHTVYAEKPKAGESKDAKETAIFGAFLEKK